MTEIARITLALLLIGGTAVAFLQHRRTIQTHQYNAWWFAVGACFEALLIWLAGGWG